MRESSLEDLLREGQAEPSEAEIAILAEVESLESQKVRRLPIKLILQHNFRPALCFSNVHRLEKPYVPAFGWMANIAEEAYELHCVAHHLHSGAFLCITPPFDHYEERECIFTHDPTLVPIYEDGEFQGCNRGVWKAPRILRKNPKSTQFYYKRLELYIGLGHDLMMAQMLASTDANARDGKPMQIVKR